MRDRSLSKTRKLFFGPTRRLKIDKKYKEILYQSSRVSEALLTAHLALKNLIPSYNENWIKGLPKLSLSYPLPPFEKTSKKYFNDSKRSKTLSLDIDNYKNIHNTTSWERAWVPLAFVSADLFFLSG